MGATHNTVSVQVQQNNSGTTKISVGATDMHLLPNLHLLASWKANSICSMEGRLHLQSGLEESSTEEKLGLRIKGTTTQFRYHKKKRRCHRFAAILSHSFSSLSQKLHMAKSCAYQICTCWHHGGDTPYAADLSCEARALDSQVGIWGGGKHLKPVSWDSAGPCRYLH